MNHEYTPPMLDFTNSEMPIEARFSAVKAMLADYECIIEFTKVNGELRTMPCTLRSDLMPPAGQMLHEDVVDIPANTGVITVWCTDKQAWRAMKTMNIISVKLAPKKWLIEVEEDPETGEAILPFPPEMLEQVGWKEGDVLHWEDNNDGSFSLTKQKSPPNE
jgi:hypothetical protein